MRPGGMVISGVFGQHVPQVTLVENQQMVQAFFSDGANPALRDGIRFGSLEGSQYAFEALRNNDVIEGSGEFGVVVMDEEAPLHRLITELPQQLAGLLSDPSAIWRCGAARSMHASRTQLDEKKDVKRL